MIASLWPFRSTIAELGFLDAGSVHSLPLSAQLGVVSLWLGIVALLALALKNWQVGGSEVLRKVVHIGVGNVIVLAWWLHVPTWVGLFASVMFSLITLLSYWVPILPMLNSVGRRSLGTFFYAASIGVLIAAYWPINMPQYAAIGVLVMTWGDGMAALIGQRWGQHSFRILGIQKSWEGSITMAIASFGVTILILLGVQGPIGATWGVAGAIAIAATILEMFSILGIDNLTVPLGSGALAFCLNHLWLGL